MQQQAKIRDPLILHCPGHHDCSIQSKALIESARIGDVYIVDRVFHSRPLYAEMLRDMPQKVFWMDGGESAKQWQRVEAILNFFQQRELVRASIVSVIGGGTLCDVASFAASLYLRGIHLHLIPTTLLAMVDAAIGGKTGINFNGIKNAVGSFYPANTVSIDTHLIASLPKQQRSEGLAEIIKAGLLGDTELLHLLDAHADGLLTEEYSDLFEEIIWRAIAVKRSIVQDDFRESGKRAFLNLGHTFAHALEASSRKYSHGIAVAWGIRCAAQLSVRMGIADDSYYTLVTNLLDRCNYPSTVSANPQRLLYAMQFDKKRNKQELRFVLQSAVKQTALYTVLPDDLNRVLEDRSNPY